jgi:YidC/Oxa1 family membrane protein insertase
MGQQFLVIRNMPTPGSEAALAREARLAKRQQRKPKSLEQSDVDEAGSTMTAEPEPKSSTQRVQPPSKNRAKKQGKKRR